jgi:hypothetical protein
MLIVQKSLTEFFVLAFQGGIMEIFIVNLTCLLKKSNSVFPRLNVFNKSKAENFQIVENLSKYHRTIPISIAFLKAPIFYFE